MDQNDQVNRVQTGDLVQLHGSTHKSHLLTVKEGEVLQTHRGA